MINKLIRQQIREEAIERARVRANTDVERCTESDIMFAYLLNSELINVTAEACHKIAQDLALEFWKTEGSYAAGKKAGAFAVADHIEQIFEVKS